MTKLCEIITDQFSNVSLSTVQRKYFNESQGEANILFTTNSTGHDSVAVFTLPSNGEFLRPLDDMKATATQELFYSKRFSWRRRAGSVGDHKLLFKKLGADKMK